MRRSNSKRFVALFLALTVFFTSGFFVMFSMDVFGAKNKDVGSAYSYVGDNKSDLTVGLRGSTCPTSANIVLTDEGSNIQGKIPKNQYNSWDPNEDGTDRLPVIPGTNGAKGTKENPFVVLEVVPDKAMQELSYFAGDEESGLPFDVGTFSAKLMMYARAKNNKSSESDYRFFGNNGNIADSVLNTFQSSFGKWSTGGTQGFQYNVFDIGDTDTTSSSLPLLDYSSSLTTEKQGAYNFNEIYNIDISVDDLLKADAMEKTVEIDEQGNEKITYLKNYSKYIKALASTEDGATDEKRIENLIKNRLHSVHLDSRLVYSEKKGGYTRHTTALVKYNLTEAFLQSNFIYPKDLVEGDGYSDFSDPDNTGSSYDIAWSRLGRSSARPSGLSNTYWKVQFRKYYVDHFEELCNSIREKEMIYIFKNNGGNYNALDDEQKAWLDEYIKEDVENLIAERSNQYWTMPEDNARTEVLNKLINSISSSNEALRKRDEILQTLLKEYAPIFEDKGVSFTATEDYQDWDLSSTKDIVSDIRTYQAEPQGGYVLAVKPGMGDMYLITDTDKIKEMGGNEDSIVFGRDKKAPTFDNDGSLKELGDPEMRWISVPTAFALTGAHPSHNVRDNLYQAGYLDDSSYTLGYASKSVSKIDDMWLAIYDRYNRRYHGGSSFDNFSKKMLFDTNVSSVWDINDKKISDTGKTFLTYARETTDVICGYHQQVLTQIFGSNKSWSDVKKLTAFGGTEKRPQNIFDATKWSNDNVGVQSIIDGDWRRAYEVGDILSKNNLVNKDGSGFFTYAADSSNNVSQYKLGKKWLIKDDVASSKYITGLCLNFNDLRYKSQTAVGTYADIYNRDSLNANGYDYHAYDYDNGSRFDEMLRDAGLTGVEAMNPDVHVPALNDSRRQLEAARYVDGDEAVLVDRSQKVTEKIKSYHFTYYGFSSNDILKKTLFTFSSQEKYDNFHYKVICVTPAEMNEIARKAELRNATISNSSASNKDTCLDLVERADMFYIHTHKSKSVPGQDDMLEAYRFYLEMVENKSVSDLAASFSSENDYLKDYASKMDSFFENDLEWSQVMKLIKRSSLKHGINVPILYNSLVQIMSEEFVDTDRIGTGQIEGAEPPDTYMYLYKDSNGSEQRKERAGNVNNIAKLFLVTIQFDLHATKGKIIVDPVTNVTVMENNNPKKIKRTFMQDIFPYIKGVNISDSYKTDSYDNELLAYTPLMTGYVQEPGEGSGFTRTLSSATGISEEFRKNTLSLWNRFTFLPTDEKKRTEPIVNMNDWSSFIQYGYLYSYYTCEGDKQNVWSDNFWKLRTGTDGTDYQNVYVLHQPGDPTASHGDSLISHYSNNPTHSNAFLRTAFQIMNYPGEPDELQINAKTRADKKRYTLLSTSQQSDEIMYEYYVNKSMYPTETVEKLRNATGDMDILISVFNSNSDPGYITKIWKQAGDDTKVEIPLSEVLVGKEGNEKCETYSPPDSYNVTNEEGASGSVSYKNMRVEAGLRKYFRIPYTIDDYFAVNSDSGDKSFNKIIIEAEYLFNNLKDNKTYVYSQTHTIDITEKDLPMLE